VRGRRLACLAALAAVCATLAACGGGGSGSKPTDLEAALAVKQVAGLFAPDGLEGVFAPACTPAAIEGNFDCSAKPILGPCTAQTTGPCRSRLAPTRVWFDCFPQTGGTVDWSCQLVEPPAGTPVFTTAAQKAAPKHAVWFCRAFNADHKKIGPFFLATDDPHGPLEQRGGAMSVDQAQQLAQQLKLRLTVEC